MHFPVFWEERYAIQKVKTGMHGYVQQSWRVHIHNRWDGVGMIWGSTNVGRRLYSNIGYAIMKEM